MSKTKCRILFEENGGDDNTVEIFGDGLSVRVGFLILLQEFSKAVNMNVNDTLNMLAVYNERLAKGDIGENYKA